MKNAPELLFVLFMMLCLTAGCKEQPQYADPVASAKADEVRIKAINDNPNLTPQQREFQINRIKGQTPTNKR